MRLFAITLILTTFGAVTSQQAEKLYPSARGDNWGFVNEEAEWKIDPGYQEAFRFTENLALVKEKEKYGYIDSSNNLVINYAYSIAYPFANGLAAVREGSSYKDKWSFIDKKGRKVIEANFKLAGSFSEGLAAVQNDSLKFGFIDSTGKTVIPFRFDRAYNFSGGLACVSRKGSWMFINKKGIPVLGQKKKRKKRLKFKKVKNAGSFSEGLAPVQNKKGKWGYINKAGKLQIKFKFKAALSEVGSFYQGLARAKKGELFGFINKSGSWVIEPQFAAAGRFSEGLAAVKTGEKWGYINTRGAWVIKPFFTDPFYYPDRYFTDFFYRSRQGAYRFEQGVALPRLAEGSGKPGVLKSDGSLLQPEE